MVRKENKKFDLFSFTKLQLEVESVYTILVVFGIFLTFILLSNNIIYETYLVWIILVSFANYIVGLLLNCKSFKIIGIGAVLAGFILFGINFIIDLSGVIKYISALIVGGSFIILGILKKAKDV